jgi:uncharacterized membrane protein YbhN (UPF0104 family)
MAVGRSKTRSRLILAAKVAVAAGLIAWLLASGRLQLHYLVSVRLSWELTMLAMLVFGSMALPAFRWWWLLRIQNIDEPLGKIFVLTWAGYAAALVLPGAASGDVARSYLILRRRAGARARALSTVLADRYLGLYSLLCLGALSVGWLAVGGVHSPAIRAMAAAILSLLLAMTLAPALLLFPPSRNLLLRALPEAWRVAWNESFALYQSRLDGILGCFGLAILSSAMTIGSFAVAGRVLGEAIPWHAAFLAGPIVAVANCLPLTPGGIGLAEATSSESFAGLGSSVGAEMMVLLRICGMLFALPGVFGILAPAHPHSDLEQSNRLT